MNDKNDPSASANDSDSIYRAPSSDTTVAPEGDLLAAYVGPKNADYYAGHFARFKSGGSSVSWNWPAFFVTTIWLLYRKMWLNALLYWLVFPLVLGLLVAVVAEVAGPAASDLFYYVSVVLIAFVLIPMFANKFYYRHAQAKVDKVAAALPEGQQSAELARIGGTSNVALVLVPFLLIALVGILAAIAIPAYQDYTIRAQVSEGLNLAGAPRAAVTEIYHDSRELPLDNEDAGIPPPNRISGQYVSSVAIDRGDIVITYGNQAHALILGNTIVLSPDPQPGGVVQWTCSSPGIAPKHLPAACR